MKDALDLLSAVKKLSIQAGDAILTYFQTDLDVTHKSDSTPVTAADMAAHDIIVAGLQQLTPDIPVLSEESTTIDFSIRSSWSRYWLVDPLDGTKEFVRGSPDFTVNIALVDKHKPILGVIYCPVTEILYFATENTGAYKSDEHKVTTAIRVATLSGKSVRITSNRNEISMSCKHFLRNFENHELIRMGSSLKSCLVAEGAADVYPRFGPTSEWDTAAAQCIVEEAGGMLVDTNLQALKYNTKDSLLNPHFIVVGDKSIDWLDYLSKAGESN